ncbi:MAG: hypothetical protein K0S39_3540 [Paenibacillus sp.]|nr:hypothetical protein [Paenibacillus sp.]
MIEWKLGIVQRIADPAVLEPGGMQEVEVLLRDGMSAKAVHYTDGGFPLLEAGDEVLLNTTAVSLRLGSGGVHFVHAVLSKPEGTLESNRPGHIMKLRYTSLQRAVLAAEEPASPYHDRFRSAAQALEGMPVLVGELHSMLPAALCWIRRLERSEGEVCRVAYIMSDGGALPLAFSKHAAVLGKLGWLAGTITYGHAYGGDIETVNKYTALLAAKHILHADIAIAAMGPGCVGTDTQYGFSGLEVGEILNAVSALEGKPVIIPRISFADPRDRHRGISHHTITVLRDIAQPGVFTALPELAGEKGTWLKQQAEQAGLMNKHKLQWIAVSPDQTREEAYSAYPLPVTSMGRGLHADPEFFAGVEAAAEAAWSCRPFHK